MAMSAAERQQLLNEGYSEEDINQMDIDSEAGGYDPTAKPGKVAPQIQTPVPGQSSGPPRPTGYSTPGDAAEAFENVGYGARESGDIIDQQERDRVDYQTGLEDEYRGQGDTITEGWGYGQVLLQEM